MKSLYDEESLHTEVSQAFGIEIENAVRPIIEKYIEQGYCVRHLSHEAATSVRQVELDYVIDVYGVRCVTRRKKREQEKKKGKTKKGS